ncbi:MAG: HAMP domain-containing sensor histidine kinase [Candidatus Margulisiibacteriota bacterium]|jgi:signal transduction histidine kinase
MINYLLYFHAFVAFMNIVLVLFLWIIQKHKRYITLGFFWIAILFATFLQGIISQGQINILFGYGSVFLINLVLATFIADLIKFKITIIKYCFILLIFYLISLKLSTFSNCFELAAIPVCIGLIFPLGQVLRKTIFHYWFQLSFIERAIVFSATIYTFLFLGYPFVRFNPVFAILGFNFAFFALFAIAVFIQALILEQIDEEKKILKINEQNLRNITYFISHEVKNTLYAVSGTTKLLSQEKISFQIKKDALENIQNSCTRLNEFSKRFLLLENLSFQHYSVNLKPISIITCIQETINLYQKNLESKQIDFQFIHDLNTSCIVETDPEMLSILISNLLHNAIKFSDPHGIILLKVKLESKQIIIIIKDHGIGIAPEKVKLFQNQSDSFFTAKNSIENKSEINTGLGLMICKQILLYLKGTMAIESELTKGTCITIKIGLKIN